MIKEDVGHQGVAYALTEEDEQALSFSALIEAVGIAHDAQLRMAIEKFNVGHPEEVLCQMLYETGSQQVVAQLASELGVWYAHGKHDAIESFQDILTEEIRGGLRGFFEGENHSGYFAYHLFAQLVLHGLQTEFPIYASDTAQSACSTKGCCDDLKIARERRSELDRRFLEILLARFEGRFQENSGHFSAHGITSMAQWVTLIEEFLSSRPDLRQDDDGKIIQSCCRLWRERNIPAI